MHVAFVFNVENKSQCKMNDGQCHKEQVQF